MLRLIKILICSIKIRELINRFDCICISFSSLIFPVAVYVLSACINRSHFPSACSAINPGYAGHSKSLEFLSGSLNFAMQPGRGGERSGTNN